MNLLDQRTGHWVYSNGTHSQACPWPPDARDKLDACRLLYAQWLVKEKRISDYPREEVGDMTTSAQRAPP